MVTSSGEALGALLSISNDLADAVERAGRSLVAVNARRHSPSTGIYWGNGMVVTADHTLERDENITVTLPDGRSMAATIAGRDAGTDIAVLKVEGVDLPAAELADAEALRVGHVVLAVARPGSSGVSASWGAVSAVGDAWRTWAGGQIDRLVHPDLTMYPGFSGGPLVNAQGQVVGMNTSGLSRNMALTVPVSTVRRVAEQLLSRGRVARGYLGLAMQSVRLPDSLVRSLDITEKTGLIVVSVENEGPAEKAGFMVGDILIALDGRHVDSTDAIQSVLDPDRVGTSITARIIRGGSPAELAITVGERPGRGE
ncbi:MAG TPA: trypsin-like peptidase domain-containing protein [Chloroflexota bacterium]|nr:trypsin-like peptidase domain-containing protein [Chloroflexota bacterium]